MGHSHPHSESRRGLTQALLITSVWFVVELVAGLYSNSLALLADAGHMLTDLAALSLSLFALRVAALPPTNTKTYGYLRAEILAALANGVVLSVVGLWVAYEGWQRLQQPPAVKSGMMLAVAVIGLGANLISARLLAPSHMENLNVRGAYLHILGDILGSVGAITAGILMSLWGWYLADPIVSLIVALLIFVSSWRLLRDSVDVLLEGVPRHLDATAILSDLGSISDVVSVHDLHVWSITSGMPAMSCHVVLLPTADPHAALLALSRLMRERYQIEHTTIQIELQEVMVKDIS